MDPVLKKKWVRALRSGRYKQGRNALRTHLGSYCCLGVLCKVAKVSFAVDDTTLDDAGPAAESLLSFNKREGDELERILAEANDIYRWSFEEIANYIEIMI